MNELEAVAKMMSVRQLTQNEREVYIVNLPGFDTHQDTRDKFGYLLAQLDQAITAFKGEMVAQGIWDAVTIAVSSDFGRTMTGNGLGTDHAWGGNYPIVSGGLAGGKIHGDYWPDLTSNSPVNVGRGRMIPTSPWDAQWHAIAQWMDVSNEQLSAVLPNKDEFVGQTLPSGRPQLLTRADVYAN